MSSIDQPTPEAASGPTPSLVPSRSATVAGSVAVIALVLLGLAANAVLEAVLGLVIGFVLAVSITAIDADRTIRSLSGGLLLLAATSGAVSLPVYFTTTGATVAAGMTIAGVAVGTGVTRFRIAAIGNGAVSRAIAWILRVTFITAVLTVVVAIVGLNLEQLGEIGGVFEFLSPIIAPTDPTAGGLGLFVSMWLAFGGIWLVVTTLPPAEVLPPSQRPRYQQVRSRIITVAAFVFGSGSVLAVVYLLGVEAGITVIVTTITPVVESVTLRSVLLQLFFGGVFLTGLILFVRSIGARVAYRRPAWVVSGVVVAGVGLIAAVVVAPTAVETLTTATDTPVQIVAPVALSIGPTATVLAGLTVGLLSIAAVLTVLPLLAGLGLLPSATAGPRLAVGGLLIGVVTSTTADGVASLLFIGALAAILVWDISEFGVGQTIDVGLTPARRDGELIHAGGSLLVGVIGFVGLTVLYQLVTGIGGSGDGIELVLLLSAAAAIVAAILLRG